MSQFRKEALILTKSTVIVPPTNVDKVALSVNENNRLVVTDSSGISGSYVKTTGDTIDTKSNAVPLTLTKLSSTSDLANGYFLDLVNSKTNNDVPYAIGFRQAPLGGRRASIDFDAYTS